MSFFFEKKAEKSFSDPSAFALLFSGEIDLSVIGKHEHVCLNACNRGQYIISYHLPNF